MVTVTIFCEDCDEVIVNGISTVPEDLQEQIDNHEEVCDANEDDEED